MSNQNWFNAAAGSNARPLGVSSFQAPVNNSALSTPTRPTFGSSGSAQNVSSPGLFASTSNFSMAGSTSGIGAGSYGNAGYGGQQGDQISKALIDESEALGKKYMESYTPGAKKKQVAANLKASGSPGGSGGSSPRSGNDNARFGTNSLYGSGERTGLSPSSSNRFRASAMSGSPLKSSRMSLGASLPPDAAAMDEDRPPTKTYADLEASRALGGNGSNNIPAQDSYGSVNEVSLSHSTMNALPVVSSSTKLRIFGVPSHLQQGLKKLFEQVGPVTYFEPGPIESNYVILAFANPAHALRALRQSGELIYNGCYLGVKEIGGDEIDLGAARREENVEMESEDMQVDSSASEPQMAQIRNNSSAPSSSRLPQSQSSFALTSGIETLQPRRTDSPFRIQAANNATRKQGSRQSQIQPEFSFGTVQPVQQQNSQQQQQQPQQQGQAGQGGLKPSTSMRFMGMFADALFGK
ncbi:hypothetical protein QFC21_001488 [Naganishia friedmannii]|uniref:Uncharacterized protein n=1 Tax=Naganishia friedmannii TaxID=89922 RepID=A0ACC2W3Z4_9TREE|nr:hypothetical protein QFC21_001488 [Naganishia friedmannii]